MRCKWHVYMQCTELVPAVAAGVIQWARIHWPAEKICQSVELCDAATLTTTQARCLLSIKLWDSLLWSLQPPAVIAACCCLHSAIPFSCEPCCHIHSHGNQIVANLLARPLRFCVHATGDGHGGRVSPHDGSCQPRPAVH